MSNIEVPWTKGVRFLHRLVLQSTHFLSHGAATHPKTTIVLIVLASVALFGIGLVTNFAFETNNEALWTPRNSDVEIHRDWIYYESGYPEEPRTFALFFHRQGIEMAPSIMDVRTVFDALDTLRSVPGYHSICGTENCETNGLTRYWDNNASFFEERVQTHEDLLREMDNTFSDGTPVVDDMIAGFPLRDTNGTLFSMQSIFVRVQLPQGDDVAEFETDALTVMLELREEYRKDTGSLTMEVMADRSFADEFERAVINDIPLVPAVFLVMTVFTCVVFFKCHRVQSRCLLGALAVVSVLLSMLAGFGLMFVVDGTFSSMTQILPFVLFGVGLDDAFIITSAFLRLDSSIEPVERVKLTVDDIGISIFLTSLTSSVAFALGGISSVPAIYRLCFYAVPSICLIFLFQMTFFIACLVLDERRVQANRIDCLFCQSSLVLDSPPTAHTGSLVDKVTLWYADKLLRPTTQTAVIIFFLALAGASAYSASKLMQEFRFTDVLPNDSYASQAILAYTDYSSRSPIILSVVFRDVDQSDAAIRLQMEMYIEDLVNNTIQIEKKPAMCWLYDFETSLTTYDEADNQASTKENFHKKVATFLANPVFRQLYTKNIVLNENGTIETSRCDLPMDNVNILVVKDQIEALQAQRAVTHDQPINKGYENRLRFFSYENEFQIWQFYEATATELRDSTLASIGAVTAISLLMPHWSAALFILPVMCMLYVDLLGVLQWAGISVVRTSILLSGMESAHLQ